jgi:hypothetical protein
MTEVERELDLMVAELELENRMMRARNERLEEELAATTAERDAIKEALERIIAISQLAFRSGGAKGISEMGATKQTTN